ncbi:hypothetical protein [Actinocatenispora sera]|uniref:hypothetical protein n=1 Tax=Actinocatenispora sera TaxID=390989 RepID=UPI000690E412|nr:hypothetical protein [Actinocatenispora sera]
MTTQRDSGVAPAGGRRFTETGRQPDEPGDNRPTDTTEPTGSTHRPYPPEPARAERREPTEHHAPPAAPDDLGNQVLGEALQQLRTAVAGARFSLATAGAAEARQLARRLAGTLDDYLSPRLAELAGPLLVVVCGPTGAGKSTLVNSLVRAPVSQAGVLRPTTRAPVLVANPADASWFGRPRLLATFARTGGTPPQGRHLQVVAAPALPPGLALLDAPDIDSVAADNRELADELMGAADAWLFVTTANRYADETPWQLLRTARDRNAGLAVVLDRMPVGEARRIRSHLSRLLAEDGLADVPLFELAESAMDHERLLPAEQVAALRDWLERLAADGAARAAVARQTLDGAIATLPAKLAELTTELAAQHRESDALRAEVRTAHAHALSTVDDAVRGGGLLGGELAARWQELVGGGELVRAVQSRSGRLRDQLLVSLAGRALPGRQFVPAARAALHSLVDETLADSARRIADAWQRGPAGTALLSDVDSYTGPDLVGQWFDDLDEWIRTDDGQRSVARQTEYTIAAVRLLVLVAVLVAPARTDATGSERAMLDTVLADPVVRRIAGTARDALVGRLRELADQQRRRYDAALNRVAVDDTAVVALSTAAAALVPARTAAALVTERRSLPPATPPVPPASAPTTGPLPGPDSPLFHPATESTGTDGVAPAAAGSIDTGTGAAESTSTATTRPTDPRAIELTGTDGPTDTEPVEFTSTETTGLTDRETVGPTATEAVESTHTEATGPSDRGTVEQTDTDGPASTESAESTGAEANGVPGAEETETPRTEEVRTGGAGTAPDATTDRAGATPPAAGAAAAPDAAAPVDAGPGGTAPGDEVPGDGVPGDAVLGDAVPGETASGEPTSIDAGFAEPAPSGAGSIEAGAATAAGGAIDDGTTDRAVADPTADASGPASPAAVGEGTAETTEATTEAGAESVPPLDDAVSPDEGASGPASEHAEAAPADAAPGHTDSEQSESDSEQGRSVRQSGTDTEPRADAREQRQDGTESLHAAATVAAARAGGESTGPDATEPAPGDTTPGAAPTGEPTTDGRAAPIDHIAAPTASDPTEDGASGPAAEPVPGVPANVEATGPGSTTNNEASAAGSTTNNEASAAGSTTNDEGTEPAPDDVTNEHVTGPDNDVTMPDVAGESGDAATGPIDDIATSPASEPREDAANEDATGPAHGFAMPEAAAEGTSGGGTEGLGAETTSGLGDSIDAEATDGAPGGKTTAKARGKATDRAPGSKTTARAGGKTTARAGGKTTNKADGKTTDRAGSTATGTAGGKTTNKADSKTTDRAGSTATGTAGGKTTNKADSKTTDKADGKATDKADSKTTNKADSKTTDKADGKTTDKADSKTTGTAGGRTRDGQPGGKTTDRAPEDALGDDDAEGTDGTGAGDGDAGPSGATDGATPGERPATDDETATGGGRVAEDGRTDRAGVADETTDGTGQEDT